MEMAKAKQTRAEKFRQAPQQEDSQPGPQEVTDELFAGGGEFFDPHDIVQVKYEMLRRVVEDGQPVSEAIRAFGFSSRQAFYRARLAFEHHGLAGLMPGKRGAKKSAASR